MEDEDDWLGLDLSGDQPTIKSNAGHNQKHELDKYAEEAKRGLQMVGEGEEHVIAGWLVYGAALNKGRGDFLSDEQFGQWKEKSVFPNLGITKPKWDDEAAAMWAAEDPDLLYRILEENPRIRTVRGAHDKWKKDNPKPKPPKGVVPTDPNLRLPTEEEAKRIKNLKDRAASTEYEPEKQAVQKKLDKLKESGIDVNSVVDQAEEDAERDAYYNEKQQRDALARKIADHLYRTKDVDTIKSLILNVFPSIEDLQKAESIYINGAN